MEISVGSPISPNSKVVLSSAELGLRTRAVGRLSGEKTGMILLTRRDEPNGGSFAALSRRTSTLSSVLGLEIGCVSSLFSGTTGRTVHSLGPRRVLLLRGTHFFSRRSLSEAPRRRSGALLIERLSPLISCFIGSTFTTTRESRTSLIKFAIGAPSTTNEMVRGRLAMVRSTLSGMRRPYMFLLKKVGPSSSVSIVRGILDGKATSTVLAANVIKGVML